MAMFKKNQEKGKEITKSDHIDIMDRIYAKENVKLSKKIAKLRELIAKGISQKEKTHAEE